MNWMTVTWLMVAGACVSLALINLLIATGDGRRAPHFFFALCALGAAVMSGFELNLMQTTDLARYESTMRWAVVPMSVIVISIAGFVWTFFGTGRPWLAVIAVGLNVLCQAVNLVTDVPAIRHATALRQVETFGGVWFTVPTIVNGPWNAVILFSAVVLLVYVVDASITLWRRGGRRRAVIVGGSIVCFFIISRGDAYLVEQGILQTPYLISFAFVGVIIAMGYELSGEVLNASRLARKLLESEQKMGLAAEAAHLGLWVWDAVQDEVWMNKKGLGLFGFDPGAKLNYATFYERIHPDDRVLRDTVVKQALAMKKTYGVEYRIKLPDGMERWIASRGGYLDTGDDKDQRMFGVAMDVTAQKTSEFQLDRQREEIAHLGRVSMMGQFAAALAHELSQPLSAMLRNAGAAKLFLQKDAPDIEELDNIVSDISDDGQRASDVIDRLRAMLRRRDIASAPLEIGELLHGVIILMRADAANRGVTVEVQVAADLPRVWADHVHIQQVLVNLLLNAMDAVGGLPDGRRQVMLRANRSTPAFVEIAVIDTGHGIAPEKLPAVFERFFTTKENGMGMGLAISQTIIEAHGGTIRAENNSGGGATFRFTLPTETRSSTP